MTSRGTPDENGATMWRRANVVVHEVFDGSVTGEGVVPSLADALNRLAVPGAVVVPSAATIVAMAVSSAEAAALYRPTEAALLRMPGLASVVHPDVQFGVDMNTLTCA